MISRVALPRCSSGLGSVALAAAVFISFFLGSDVKGRSVRIEPNSFAFLCRVSMRHNNKTAQAYATSAQKTPDCLLLTLNFDPVKTLTEVLDEAAEKTIPGRGRL